jgi:hypothetical protein
MDNFELAIKGIKISAKILQIKTPEVRFFNNNSLDEKGINAIFRKDEYMIAFYENWIESVKNNMEIMKKGEYSDILKNEKENGSNRPYHFVQVPDSNHFIEKFSLIKGTKMWDKLREIYLEKKEKQHETNKEDRIYSFALLQEATNEVLQKFDLI